MSTNTIIPTTRTISPFSSYNSDVVNKLTRMVTDHTNCIFSTHAIEVISDSTSSLDTVIVGLGQGFIDDVLIETTEEFFC